MARKGRTWSARYRGSKQGMQNYKWGYSAYLDNRWKGVPLGPPYGSEAWKALEAARAEGK